MRNGQDACGVERATRGRLIAAPTAGRAAEGVGPYDRAQGGEKLSVCRDDVDHGIFREAAGFEGNGPAGNAGGDHKAGAAPDLGAVAAVVEVEDPVHQVSGEQVAAVGVAFRKTTL